MVVRASSTGGTDDQSIAVTVTNANEAPVITSNGGGPTASVSVAENTTGVTTVTSTDPEGDVRSYSIVGGADAALFTIDSVTGALTFIGAPNFEAPTDAGGNNIYDVIIRATSTGGTDDQAVAVTITNANEAPVITSNGGGPTASVSVAENTTGVTTVTSTDPEGDVRSYSIVGGADAALFTIDSVTGVLTFIGAPNFEAPTDAGGNNIYDVIIRATSTGGTDDQAVAVTITNVNEAPVITSNGGGASAAINVAEGSAAITTVTSTDPEGDVRTYSIAGGADAALFSIDSVTGVLTFIAGRDFEAPGDAGTNNIYDVIIRATRLAARMTSPSPSQSRTSTKPQRTSRLPAAAFRKMSPAAAQSAPPASRPA